MVAPKKANVSWENFLTPLDDRLLVEIASGERMTAGGLYIPDTAADLSGNFKGKVVVAGRGHRDDKGRVRPMDVRTGDTVLFSEDAGTRLNLMGQEILLLRESDVLGIVDKK
jgi:chaperonin GroES